MTAKTNSIKKFAVVLLGLISAVSFAQITVDTSLSTQELVQDILINGTCAETSNFIASTGIDFGEENGIAAFDGSGTDFPFAGGVVLTSGDVNAVPGPNLNVESSGGWPGDLDLETFTGATNTNDASFIQFDFVPLTEQLSFDFIMASEEYDQNFECTFSDAFAFILTDLTTGISENLAVVPGTTTPIQVTNIRPEVVGQCDAVNEEFFGQYNFQPFNDENAAAINMNGQTVELTASSDVIIGNTYTIKLVVADSQDTLFNMSVFIEAGSFNIGSTDLGENLLIAAGNAPCEGDTVVLDATDPDASTYTWFFNDVEIAGETNPTLEITEAGTYTVEVTIEALGDCVIRDEITIEFINGDAVNLGEDMSSCTGDTFTIDSGLADGNATFVWLLDGTEITGETDATLDVTTAGTYTIQATFNESCTFSDDVLITFNDTPTLDLGDNINSCLDDPITLDATPDNVDPALATYQWFLNGGAIAGATNATFDAAFPGTYTVEVTLDGCIGTDAVTIVLANPDGSSCTANDLCMDAEPVACGDVVVGSTVGTTTANDPGTCGTTSGAGGVWFTFAGTGDFVELSLCNSNYDTKLQVFSGTCDALVCIDGVDDTCGLQSEVDFQSEAGVEYFFYVFGFGTAQGDYELVVTCSTVCDIEVELGEDQSICDETSFEIVPALTGSSLDSATFLWNTGDTTQNLTVTESGTYTLEVLSDSCTTAITDSVTITLGVTPEIDLGADFNSCFETPETLTVTLDNVDPADVTFEWTLNGGVVAGATTETLEITAPGEYSVTVDSEGCVATDTITITLANPDGTPCDSMPPPDGDNCAAIDAGPDAVVSCEDPCTDLTATFLGITGSAVLPFLETTSYTVDLVDCPLPPIDGGDPTNLTTDDVWSDTIDIPFTFSFYGNDYTSLTVGANGQISFDTSLSGNFNDWSIDIGQTIPVNDPGTFPLNTIYGAFHDINPGTNADPDAINFFVSGTAPFRTFVLNFDAVPQFSCGDLLTSQQIILYETFNVIDVNIIEKEVCATWNDGLAVIGLMGNDLTEFSVPPGRNTDDWAASNESWRFLPNGDMGNPNVSFEWTDEDGIVVGTDVTINVCPIVDTTYTLTVTVSDDDGNIIGSNTDTVTVTVDSVGDFDIDLGEDQFLCDEDSFEIVNTLTGDDVDMATFLWNTGDTTQNLVVTVTGTYTVEVTVGGCTLMESVFIEFGESPVFDLGGDFTSCFEMPVILDATPSNVDPALVTYQWFLDGDDLMINTATLEITEAGDYQVIAEINGCTSTQTITISLGEPPILDLGDDITTCFETSIILDATPSNYDPDSVIYEWFLNDEEIIGADTAQFEIFEIGTYQVVVTFGECVATSTITISPRDDLEVALDESFQTCPDMSNTLTAATNETGVTYQWFLNGEEISGETTATLEFSIPALTLGDQVYSVIISEGDCTGEASTTITLYDVGNCVISQGISPDGSPGFNDFLDLTFLSDRSGIENLEIYNRHGRLVFEQQNYSNEWRGQTDLSGDLLPTGTYFYVINFTNEDPEYGRQSTGWIYLNRSAE